MSLFRKKHAPTVRTPFRRRAPLICVGLEARAVPATIGVAPGGSIQAALNAAAASPGADTINVPAGTYTEALVINDSNPVTLQANGTVTIKAPATMTPVTLAGSNVGAAVIDIYSKNATVAGFIVDGSSNADGNLESGIRVIKGGMATIKNNTVTGLLNAGDGTWGIGIQVGTFRAPTANGGSGTAKVNGNTVGNYLGAGVLVDGAGSSANVKGNKITGRGAANGVVEYGIQVSRGATARVEGNTISGNDSGGTQTATSAGIFFYQDGGLNSVAAKNTVKGNEVGILVQDSNGNCAGAIEIVNNDVTGTPAWGYAGIEVLNSNNIEVENNDVFSNASANGIALNYSSHVSVEGNSVYNNANADGIYDFQGNTNFIKCNDSYGNGFNGIFVDQTTNDQIWNNCTHGNHNNGIYVSGGSSNDIWLGDSNTNLLDGMRLENTVGNTIVSNSIVCNGGYGINLINADNTYIAFDYIAANANGAIHIDSNSTGTVQIGNRTSNLPCRDGSSGSGGNSCHYSNAHSRSDDDCRGLDD